MKKVIFAKKIYTMNKENEYFTCMIVEDNIIKDLNMNQMNDTNLEFFDEIENYPENVIIPGFNDSHIHVFGYGRFLDFVDLIGCESKNELLLRVKKRVDVTPEGTWIFGRGWDHEKFKKIEFPNRFELDKLSRDHPIFLHRICGHIVVVNSSALSIGDITAKTENPPGGIIDRNENGEPTGILRETAINLVSHNIPKLDRKKKKKILINSLNELNRLGITSTQANDGYDLYEIYKSLGESLTVRTYLGPFIEELEDLIKIGAETDKNGKNKLRWGRIKIYSDGSLGGETAAMKESYENSSNKGVLIYPFNELLNKLKHAHESGWQLEAHAIGDYAAELVIKAFEQVGATKNRCVLTHCQILNKNLISKMKDLGIIANIQPIFINTDLHWAEKKIGKERIKYSYAWKSLLENKIHCAGGSDAPVEHPNPILGIHSAVNRQDINGYPKDGWYNNQAISVFEAVKLFTVNSAFAEYQEDRKGKLIKNMFADFIVLDRDIFTIPKLEIRQIKVIATYLNANQVFSKKLQNIIRS